ncbi:protein delta homolog 1 [Gastrophryne carolinensis]
MDKCVSFVRYRLAVGNYKYQHAYISMLCKIQTSYNKLQVPACIIVIDRLAVEDYKCQHAQKSVQYKIQASCSELQGPPRGRLVMMELPWVCALSLLLLQSVASEAKGACRPGCHPEHGFCESDGECRCRPGWRGQSCDQCLPLPGCLHGGCNQPWQCLCEEGWTGSHCDIDIHPCLAYPCSRNSTCIETGDGGYICICAPGYTGKNCLVRIGPCTSKGSPCQNGGTCLDNNGFSAQASCQCPDGFEGKYCEAAKDDCNPNPCANGGNCTDVGLGYHCHCPLGFGGPSCTELLTGCSSNPCANGGTCYEKSEGFRCSCLPEYSGDTCSLPTKVKDVHTNSHSYNVPPHHKPFHRPGHEVLKITMKETIHNMGPFLNRGQIIGFIILGLLTCLIVLITTGIVFFSKCETWLANAKYSHLIQKKKDFYMRASTENNIEVIFPEKVKVANYNRCYTTI